jgi:L-ascorbate metabolism protein UlaG (beta-lactamase superfamily)
MMIDRRLLLIVAIFAVVPISALAKVPDRGLLTLTYLGNAGWQIEDGHTVIIVDPFVSQFHDKRMGDPNTSEDSDEVHRHDEPARLAAK